MLLYVSLCVLRCPLLCCLYSLLSLIYVVIHLCCHSFLLSLVIHPCYHLPLILLSLKYVVSPVLSSTSYFDSAAICQFMSASLCVLHCHILSFLLSVSSTPSLLPPYAQVTYIQPIVSTSSVGAKDAAVPHIVSVNGIIGTRWSRRHILPVVYHLGPTYLFEETVSSQGIKHIARLGPTYMGCFQAPVIKDYVSVCWDGALWCALLCMYYGIHRKIFRTHWQEVSQSCTLNV